MDTPLTILSLNGHTTHLLLELVVFECLPHDVLHHDQLLVVLHRVLLPLLEGERWVRERDQEREGKGTGKWRTCSSRRSARCSACFTADVERRRERSGRGVSEGGRGERTREKGEEKRRWQ
jgi:hypothetical protein